jgi:hypothetical protein
MYAFTREIRVYRFQFMNIHSGGAECTVMTYSIRSTNRFLFSDLVALDVKFFSDSDESIEKIIKHFFPSK